MLLPMAAATAALLASTPNFPGAYGSWLQALLSGVVVAGALFVLFLVHPRGFGFGDVKLALNPGVAHGWYGWQPVLAGGFLGFLLFAVHGAAADPRRSCWTETVLPFGPFLLVGGGLGVLPAGAGA